MKDRYLIVIIIAATIGWFFFVWWAIDDRDIRYVGLPAGAACTHDSPRVCVADGVEYRCVVDWGERIAQCAPTWRAR